MSVLKRLWSQRASVGFNVLILIGGLALTRKNIFRALLGQRMQTFEGPSYLITGLSDRENLFFVVAGLALLGLSYRTRWTTLEHGAQLRWLVFPVAAMLALYCALTPYSLQFDQAFLCDRLVILLVAALAFRFPGAIGLLLVLCLIQMGEQSTLGFVPATTDKRLALELLLLFVFFLPLRQLTGTRSASFLMALLIIVGAVYFGPFIAKVKIAPVGYEWVFEDNLADLFAMCTTTGWLPMLTQETIIGIARVFSFLSVPLALGTVLIESGGVLLPVHRRAALVLLVLNVLLHLGIFFGSGIFFWKWVVVDLALLIFYWRTPDALEGVGWWTKGLACVAILFAPYTVDPPKLGWWDTPIDQSLQIEVELESGETKKVAATFFAPHGIPFARGRFYELYDVRRLVGTFGTTISHKTFTELKTVRTPAEAKARLSRPPPKRVNKRKLKRMDRYMRAVFSSWNRHGGRPLWWLAIFPAHIMRQPESPALRAGDPPVRTVVFKLREVFYDGEQIHLIDERVLRRIEIPPQATQD